MRLARADELTTADLAALLTAGYEGYFVPVQVDGAALEPMLRAWDIDLGRSWVAESDEGPVGIALLGARGEHGWIGGLGVVPAARRAGVGRALMEAVLDSAPSTVTLEVIEQNEPARRLYEELGFDVVRELEVWSLTAEPAVPEGVEQAEPRPLGQEGLPWQRDDPSLPADYERLETDGGASLVRVSGPRVSVLQLRADGAEPAARLLAAARNRGESLHYVNVPADDPAGEALRALGGSLDLRQVELMRRSA